MSSTAHLLMACADRGRSTTLDTLNMVLLALALLASVHRRAATRLASAQRAVAMRSTTAQAALSARRRRGLLGKVAAMIALTVLCCT